MADIAKLKTSKASGPPPESAAPGNTDKPPRDKPSLKSKIEFSGDQAIIEEFSELAGRKFGFKKGSKSEMFLALLEHYNRTSG